MLFSSLFNGPVRLPLPLAAEPLLAYWPNDIFTTFLENCLRLFRSSDLVTLNRFEL